MFIKINDVYKHFKSKIYKVIALGKHTEANEDLVVYKALYDDHLIWCRPVSMWNELVEYDGKIIKRFELIEDNYGQV